MNWTRPPELRAQLQKLWDNGALLAGLVPRPGLGSGSVAAPVVFPLQLGLLKPTSTEMVDSFNHIRSWSRELQALPHSRLVMREFKHRQLGINLVPHEVWVDSLDHALAWLGRQSDAQNFALLCSTTQEHQPLLMNWLRSNAMAALELASVWGRFLQLIEWLQKHPRPGIYLRQLDIAGISLEFLNQHRAVLGQLLDASLPASVIDSQATAAENFLQRYGFAQSPTRIRFRLLDPWHPLASQLLGSACDLALDAASFAQLPAQQCRVFITSSECNFLAFPAVRDALVIFCDTAPLLAAQTQSKSQAQALFEALGQVAWLQQASVYFWGDIDVASFVLLNDLRLHLGHAQSLLMNRATLLAAENRWSHELAAAQDSPAGMPGKVASFASYRSGLAMPRVQQGAVQPLPLLNSAERSLVEELQNNRLKKSLNLSQNDIPWHRVLVALAALES